MWYVRYHESKIYNIFIVVIVPLCLNLMQVIILDPQSYMDDILILKTAIYETEIAIGISDQIKWCYLKKNVYIIYYSTTLNWYII